ncbi:ABC transporter permease [Mesorhizobium sp. ORM6]
MTPRAASRFPAMAANFGLPIAIVVIVVCFGLFDARIVSSGNLWNIATQWSYLTLFAMAQTMVLLTRGFDLSLGFTVSLVSVVSALVMTSVTGSPILLAIAAGFGVALATGLANGILIGAVGINPLVTTLGIANIVMTLAFTISGGFPVPIAQSQFSAIFAEGVLFGVPVPIVIAVVVFAILFFVQKATVFGRSLYLIGTNPRAARAAGIRTKTILVLDYALCAFLAAVGALMLTARTGSGEPNLGGGLALQSIAAAVVGGVRLSGGEGGVTQAAVGALFVTVLSNVMNFSQIDGYIQQIILGGIILMSLVLAERKKLYQR